MSPATGMPPLLFFVRSVARKKQKTPSMKKAHLHWCAFFMQGGRRSRFSANGCGGIPVAGLTVPD